MNQSPYKHTGIAKVLRANYVINDIQFEKKLSRV